MNHFFINSFFSFIVEHKFPLNQRIDLNIAIPKTINLLFSAILLHSRCVFLDKQFDLSSKRCDKMPFNIQHTSCSKFEFIYVNNKTAYLILSIYLSHNLELRKWLNQFTIYVNGEHSNFVSSSLKICFGSVKIYRFY